ncbi:MAG: TPM domain-containing protein [Cyanobacteria bacterium J069]|nr:MAG: YgcG family protein [Cyanobacteria bacterium J069]
MTHFFKQLSGGLVNRISSPLRGVGSAIALVLSLWLWVSGAAPALATGVYELPVVRATDDTWIVDEGDVLSRLNEGNISGTLSSLSKKTGNNVRLVTIHRLDYGETIQSFADQLFEQWFPEPADQANQVLLVLDTVTNNGAIHVGEAAKDLLTDEIATSVVDETLAVPLRQGDRYNQAFLDVTTRLSAVLAGNPDPGPPVIAEVDQTEGTFATPEETAESNATVWVIGLLFAATVIPMATYYWYQMR